MTENIWDIFWLVVSPDRRGQGAGGTLLAFAQEQIKKYGGRLAIIETSAKPEYEKTRCFCLKHGYKIACRIADFYALNDDKIILQKRLTRNPDRITKCRKDLTCG